MRQDNKRGDELVLLLGGVVPTDVSRGECPLPVGAECFGQIGSNLLCIAVLGVGACVDVGLIDGRQPPACELGVRFEL